MFLGLAQYTVKKIYLSSFLWVKYISPRVGDRDVLWVWSSPFCGEGVHVGSVLRFILGMFLYTYSRF